MITGVAQWAVERLAALVYLDAFVPRPGESVLALLALSGGTTSSPPVDGSNRVALDWDAAMDGWTVRAPADRVWLRSRLRPHSLGALADPLPPTPVPDLPRH